MDIFKNVACVALQPPQLHLDVQLISESTSNHWPHPDLVRSIKCASVSLYVSVICLQTDAECGLLQRDNGQWGYAWIMLSASYLQYIKITCCGVLDDKKIYSFYLFKFYPRRFTHIHIHLKWGWVYWKTQHEFLCENQRGLRCGWCNLKIARNTISRWSSADL